LSTGPNKPLASWSGTVRLKGLPFDEPQGVKVVPYGADYKCHARSDTIEHPEPAPTPQSLC